MAPYKGSGQDPEFDPAAEKSSVASVKSSYLNNLNALRFFAASSVIFSHLELEKCLAHLPNIANSSIVHCAATEAVKFFFVLSGFLITYLLLKERDTTRTVDIGAFYARRILRIWPLYYATVLIAFMLVPHFHFATAHAGFVELSRHYWQVFTLYLFFLPNLARLIYEPVPAAMQCWSVGVEEQFYFIWPLLIRMFGKTPLRVLFAIILAKSLLLRFFAGHQPLIVASYLHSFCIEAMVSGGLAAYYFLYANKPGQSKAKLALLICATASCVTWLVCGQSASQVGWLLVYAVLIALSAQMPKIGGKLYAPLEYLGNISYGIYMLHPLAILIVIKFLTGSRALAGWEWIPAYVLSFAFSIALASTSYHLMEAPILKLKRRFEPARKQNQLIPCEVRAIVGAR